MARPTKRTKYIHVLVHLDGQTSNQLLTTLEQWTAELEAHIGQPQPNM